MYQEEVLGYSILTKQDLEAIHEATLRVMKEGGVRVYGEEAHEIFSTAGCEVNKRENLIKFPPQIVNDAILSAPAEYTLYGRDPKFDVKIGGKKVTYTNFGTGTEIIDPETGERRTTTKQDVAEIARFCDAIDEIDFFTIAVAAQDVPGEIKDIHEAEAVFPNTAKHYFHDPECGKNTKRVIEMAAAITGGKDQLRKRPIITLGTCPNSPLEIHEHAAEIIIETAKAGLPINVLSMGLSGATTPVTLAGTLVVTNAEVLAGIVLSQLVNKGNPVQYGSSTTIMDLMLTTSPVGAPEHAMYGAAVGQIGHFYEIPTYVGGT
jgi:trimethylamine--corrinoid protein Co-methyltransferase